MSRASQHPSERDRPGLQMALAALERRERIYPGAAGIPRLLLEQISNPYTVLEPSYDALQAERDQLRAQVEEQLHRLIDENHKLRAELDAIRGQEPVATVQNRYNADGLSSHIDVDLPAGTKLYALPPQQPDAVRVPMDPQLHDYRQDLQCWFGLGRASWCTIPRVLMEAMPEEWQRRAAILLHEYSEAFPGGSKLPTPYVQARAVGKITKWPAWINNYRHPDRAEIEGLRLSTRHAEEGE